MKTAHIGASATNLLALILGGVSREQDTRCRDLERKCDQKDKQLLTYTN
jgi:hypothetical protein